MDIPGLLQRYSRRVESLLEAEIPRHGAEYLSDGVWYQFGSGGKRLRPGLCLLTCEQLGGKVERALPFALAAEILHNLLLIHDDIEDGDTMRRDQKTLWAHLGLANAINVGDYLTAHAYRILLGSDLPEDKVIRLVEIYSLTFQRTVEGQALDINLRGRDDLTVEQYYRIVQLKTAHYLTFNLVGGAIAAGIDGEVIEQLWELGRCLGPAFQIRDDIIDLTEGKGRGGELGCDVREGKPSIFYACALERLETSDSRRQRLVEIVRRSRDETTADEVSEAVEIFRSVGAFEFADAECRKLIDRAFALIEDLPLDASGRELFRAISRFMIDRKS